MWYIGDNNPDLFMFLTLLDWYLRYILVPGIVIIAGALLFISYKKKWQRKAFIVSAGILLFLGLIIGAVAYTGTFHPRCCMELEPEGIIYYLTK